ncbi:TPA: hypothetical protein ACPQXX_001910, partial [Streptococcus mutans]
MSFSKFFNFLVLSIKISQHFKQRKNDKESNSRKFLINLYFKTRGASLFLVHKKVHLDYAVSDQTNRS